MVDLVMDWIVLVLGLYHVLHTEQGLLYKIAVTIAITTMMGGSINLSHEIGHKSSKFEQFLGTFNLSKNLYMHFFIEHNYGHHRRVATKEDPATSLYNETLGAFMCKSVYGGYMSAWEIENERCLDKYGRSFSIYNKMIYFTLCYLLTPTSICFFFGWKAMTLFLICAIGSFLMLENINYIEHYGLLRQKEEDGKYENVNIHHSWNAPHRLSNYLLFKLQRHSDHHENSKKPYQTLCSYEESPLLPCGYTSMILVSQNQSLWF